MRSILKLTIGLVFVLGFGISCAGCPGDEPPVIETPAPTTGGDNDFGADDGDGDGGVTGREVRTGLLQTIYFDYDRSTIREDQKATLRANAGAIRDYGWGTVVVEGHCDERGSEEYNLALGERRASAVSRYLQDSGVGSTRIDTVSFGEARPEAAGHSEASWSRNRRADFRIVE